MQETKFDASGKTENSGREISLNGWVNRIRNLGKIMFFDLEYAGGKTQVIVKDQKLVKEMFSEIQTGDLITVKGEYQNKERNSSPNLGEEITELLMKEWKIINKTILLPFEIKDGIEIKEDNKYRYRYLDLRRGKSRNIIVCKHKMLTLIRNFFNEKNFIEIETPILSQNSPEGAKTFVVPSKIADRFYTLPQSPQIFKQTLMVGGFDKYYQIAKSFRNEDARSNRQPEFLQLDIEMSFTSEKKIFEMTKKLMKKILKDVFFVEEGRIRFEEIKFEDCIDKYGTDKPDLRNPLEIIQTKKEVNFPSFKENLEQNESQELGMYIPLKSFPGEQFINNLISEEKQGIEKFSLLKFEEKQWNQINGDKMTNTKDGPGDLREGFYLTIVGKVEIVRDILFTIRSYCNRFFLSEENNNEYRFVWITNWPLFDYDKKEERIVALRHPFSIPNEEDIIKLSSDEAKNHLLIKTQAFDLVCNGEEFASGSLRIFKKEMQKKVFEILGFNSQEIEEHFGYFLKALGFAAPPHGGIAFGIERMLAVFLNLGSLKETIAFPKNIDGSCSLTGAPNKLKI